MRVTELEDSWEDVRQVRFWVEDLAAFSKTSTFESTSPFEDRIQSSATSLGSSRRLSSTKREST